MVAKTAKQPNPATKQTQGSKPSEPKAPSKGTTVLRIVSTAPKGHRRAGYRFGKKPKEIPVGDLDRAQAKAFEQDPRLVVAVAEVA